MRDGDDDVDVVGSFEVRQVAVHEQVGHRLAQRRVDRQVERSEIEHLLVLALEPVEPGDVDARGGSRRRRLRADPGSHRGDAADRRQERAPVVLIHSDLLVVRASAEVSTRTG